MLKVSALRGSGKETHCSANQKKINSFLWPPEDLRLTSYIPSKPTLATTLTPSQYARLCDTHITTAISQTHPYGPTTLQPDKKQCLVLYVQVYIHTHTLCIYTNTYIYKVSCLRVFYCNLFFLILDEKI